MELRALRKILDIGLPLAGVVVILSAVLFLQEIRSQIAIILIGIIMIEAGVWKISHRFLSNDRKYNHLRNEIDNFIVLCRKLNTVATELRDEDSSENKENFENIRNDLQDCFDRIIEVAGKTEEDITDSKESIQTIN